MGSLENKFIEDQKLNQELITTIRLLGEYKGKQELLKEQAPQVLDTLRQAAIIQSTESSNRIEGIIAPPRRIQELVEEKTKPQDRSEQEIAGYRDVLKTIHVNHESMPFTPGIILQLHRDLYQFVPREGGSWKSTDNEIVEITPDGKKKVRFKPVPAHATREAM